MQFFIRTVGDSSVGIGCDEAALITNVDHLESPEERQEYIAMIKEGLVATFGNIFGSKVTVTTDEEEAALASAMCDTDEACVKQPPLDPEKIREAFFNFLVDLVPDVDGDPDWNMLVSRAQDGLHLEGMAKALGYHGSHGVESMLYASGAWDPPDVPDSEM